MSVCLVPIANHGPIVSFLRIFSFIYSFKCARVCSVFACLCVCLYVYNSWTLFSPSIMWFLGIKFTLPELVSSTFTRWASHWGVFSWPLRPQIEVYSSVQTGISSLNTMWVWLHVAKQNLGKPREARVNSINGRLNINPSVALLPPSLPPTPAEEGLYHWAKSPAPLLWLLLWHCPASPPNDSSPLPDCNIYPPYTFPNIHLSGKK